MRFWLLLLMSFTSILTAAEQRIYLGCSQKDDVASGIFLTSLNSETGVLQPLQRVATTENPSFLTLSAKGDFLYSVAETAEGAVVAWRVEKEGSLQKLNEQPAGGKGPCHVTLSPSGRVLLVANYSSGNIAAFPIQKNGSLGPQSAFFQLTGSGPNPQRQKQPHAHGIYCDSTGKWVYVTDLGTDRVWIFRLDAATGTLTPNEPAFASLPPGSGPRHLAFSEDATYAYVNGEMSLAVTVLRHDSTTGALEPVSTIPVFSPDMKSSADTAEVALHPNGKTLYLSTRGYSSISAFNVSSDGGLTLLENVSLPVNGPRHFSVSPDGKWLVVPGQNSHQVTVLAIDSTTGKIQPTGHIIEANGPMCAVFAP